jgi:parallel beta-helix repeat protein
LLEKGEGLGRLWAGLVSGFWVLVLFVAVFGVVLNVPVVWGSGTIYIRADGSIDPPTAPISTIDNVTYTFADNINDHIVVERSNIIIDGAGYMLQGFGTGTENDVGFYLSGINNVTIKNTTIRSLWGGLLLDSSSFNTISGNNITGNWYGVMLRSWSFNNTILGNNITDNGDGIWSSSPSNTFSENSIRNNGIGIHLWSSFNTVSGNNITDNDSGVWFDMGKSSFNTVSGNNITDNRMGIYTQGGPSNNTISGNNITDNDYGIYLYWTSFNTVSGNNITDNGYGVWLFDLSSYNSFFRNKFLNNTNQVSKHGYANTWDTGYPSGGNYWSDYTGVDFFSGTYQNVTGSDGIGDVPHVIDVNNQDKYPLMYHWSPIPANFTYITPDGLIDPPTAPIHRVGDLYELTSNISGSIVVQRDNILIDGRGYKVQGSGAPWRAPGIYLSNRSNVTVKNAKIQDFGNGVVVKSIGKVVIEKNEIVGNSESGIMIMGESNVLIKENIIIMNKNGIATDVSETHSGIAVVGNTISSNKENGIYLSSHGEGSPFGGHSYGYIFNVTISASAVTLNGRNGIYLDSVGIYYTSVYGETGDGYSHIYDVTVSSNNVSSNKESGIYLSSYGHSELSSGYGFSYISNVTLSSNSVLFNGKNGVHLSSSQRNGYYAISKIYDVRLSSNNVSLNNENGIYLDTHTYWGLNGRDSYIYDVTISSNNVLSNGGNGIQLYSSSYDDGFQGRGSGHIFNIRLMSNNVSLNNGSGIYLHGYGYGYGYGSGFGSVYNVTLSSNTVLSNKENGIYMYGQGYSDGYSGGVGYGWGDGSVYNVAFSFNNVSLNDGDGVYVHAYGYGYGHDYGPGYGYIHHITLLSENLSLNGGNGLNLYSHGYSSSSRDAYAYGYIYNVTLISCRISSNGRTGVYSYSDSYAYSYGDGYGYSYSYIYDFSLVSNTISKNHERGLGFDAKTDIYNVTAYYNNFINNTIQVYISESYPNIWDDGYPSGGNYWSDYTGIDEKRGPDQDQLGSDGIGDTPYVINVNNRDRYPLMIPLGDITPPVATDDYNGLWQPADFTITLTATDDLSGVAEIYYKINDGLTKTVSADGQPLITTEGADNKLEYWSIDKAGNEELPHKILTGIKLDETYPTIETPSRMPDGDVLPDQPVKVSVSVTDATSQVKNVTLSYTINDGETWTDLPMNHTASNLYEATIPPQQADTTVRFKITAYDHAGNNATLDGTQPYCTYQVIPEFPPSLILPLFIITTLLAAICFRRKQKTTLKII